MKSITLYSMRKSYWSIREAKDPKTKKMVTRLMTTNELGIGGSARLSESDCVEIATTLLDKAREMRLERQSNLRKERMKHPALARRKSR